MNSSQNTRTCDHIQRIKEDDLQLEIIIGFRRQSLSTLLIPSLFKKQTTKKKNIKNTKNTLCFESFCQQSMQNNKSRNPRRRYLSLHVLLFLISLFTPSCSCFNREPESLNNRKPFIRSKINHSTIPTFRGWGADGSRSNFSFTRLTSIDRWENDDNLILIGSKNNVYMFNNSFDDESPSVLYSERLYFPPSVQQKERCKTYNEEMFCENDIRQIFLKPNGKLRVCGTFGAKGQCRYYTRDDFHLKKGMDESNYSEAKYCDINMGNAKVTEACSKSKTDSISIQLTNKNSNKSDIILAAYSSGQFRDEDPIMIRSSDFMKTNKYSFESNPDFIKMLSYGEKVYIFFSEGALKGESPLVTERKTRYSRVAQVCKDDKIEEYADKEWNTFSKSRILCTLQKGDGPPMVYDVITSVSDVVTITEKNSKKKIDVVYATFTTPKEWIIKQTSVVCMYKMTDIIENFEKRRYFDKKYVDNVYYPIEPVEPPTRLSTCSFLTKDVSKPDRIFAKSHTLIVSPLKGKAIFLTEDNVNITTILVDSNAAFKNEVMLYLGTDKGSVLRVKPRKNMDSTIYLEEMNFVNHKDCKIDPKVCEVKALLRTEQSNNSAKASKLLICFKDRVVFSNLATCSGHTNKTICEADPECGYSRKRCVQRTLGNSEFLGPVDEIEGRIDAVAEKASPAKMIQDWVESFEPELTRNLFGFGPKFKLEERRNCMLKLREALNHTANQVIANFKNHHTLPYIMTSHVTHTNPLLMHTIESLHKKAYGIIENYFNKSNKSQVLHCMRRKSCLKSRSLSLPLAPSLWLSLKNFMENEYAPLKCENDTSMQSLLTDSCLKPKCDHSVEGHCWPTKCSWKTLTNARSFFRLSRYRYEDKNCFEPFKKFFHFEVPSKYRHKKVRKGETELKVDSRYPMTFVYDPREEKITMKFTFKVLKRSKVHPPLHKRDDFKLQTALYSIIEKMFSSIKNKNLFKNKPYGETLDFNKSIKNNNAIPIDICEGCTCYKTEPFVLKNDWDSMRKRARSRGVLKGQGDKLTSNKLIFDTKDDLNKFFRENCTNDFYEMFTRQINDKSVREPKNAQIKHIVKRNVSVFVDSYAPFEIEHKHGNKIQLVFYVKKS